MKPTVTIAVTIRIPEDQDLLDLVHALGRGNVSPWIKQAMREKTRREEVAT